MSRASLLSLCIVLGILLAAPVPALGQTANATDIEISKQAIPPFSDPTPEAINVGERFRYELTVTNNGPNVAAGVTFTDLLPAGVSFFDFGSVNQFITCNQGAAIGKICTNGDSVRCGHAVDGAPEGSISCEVLVTMDVGESRKAIFSVDAVVAGTITNSARAEAGTLTDLMPANNDASAIVTIEPEVPPTTDADAEISVTATTVSGTEQVGSEVRYSFRIENAGPDRTTGVTLTYTLPDTLVSVTGLGGGGGVGFDCSLFTRTCSDGVLDAGEVTSVSIRTEMLGPGTGEIGLIVNADARDSDLSNNSDSHSIDVVQPTTADVAISKVAVLRSFDPTPEALNVGERFTYELWITNNGPDIAPEVTFTDVLPAGVSFFNFGSVNQFITCNQGAAIGKICTNGDSVRCGHAVDGAPEGSISCEVLVTMDVGDSRLARISVDATQAGVVINTANAQIASLTDPVASNDSDSASVTIAPPPNSPPVADAQSITVEARVSTSILLTGSDPDNDALTFAIKSGPVNGELSGTQPNMVYLSDSGFVGSDAFTFVSNDGEFDSAAATVSINVVDTTPPSLSVPDDLIVEATATRTPLDIGAASASDTVDGLLVPTSDAPTNGFPLGETTVVWTVADSSGNEASATQSVRVIDTTPPVLTVPGDITHDASAPLTNVDIGQATAADIFPVTLSNDAPADGYPVGTTVVTWTAVDTSGNVSVAVQNVTMTNDPPALDPIADTTIDEGDTLSVTASFSDADSVSWTATADYGDGGGPEALAVDTVALTMALIHTYADNGSYPVTVSITDAEGDTDTTSFSVTVNNVAPVLSNLTVAPALAELGNHTVSASVDFVDPGVLDTHTVTINWGDGSIESATVTEANGSGSASATHQYAATGVYTVTMSVTDKDGATSTAVFQFVVIYDPSGGFVTGGGWIDSPLGACQLLPACMTMTGKATFGFVSKYKKGATTPTGKTEFQFQAGDLNFHSSSYDWLVIAGAKAMYKGIGTINGVGNYGFMLSAIDANLTPSTDVDLFRIKIWDKDSGDFVVYDNQLADAEDADPTTAIGGGSIKIHKAKK